VVLRRIETFVGAVARRLAGAITAAKSQSSVLVFAVLAMRLCVTRTMSC
jgi:hypothetical protein